MNTADQDNTLKYQALSSAAALTESKEGWVIGSCNGNTDGIISSIQSAMSFAYDPAIAAISRDSSFKLSDLRNSKSTIYVVMPEAEDYAGLSYNSQIVPKL